MDDAGTSDGGATVSDGGFDAGYTVQTESGNNNADTATNVNAVVVPGEISGAIDPASDLDVLHTNVTAGEFWQWEMIAPSGSTLQPHLAVGEHANVVPALVGRANGVGQSVTQEQFVLRSGRYNLIIRDARKVASSQAQQGGPTHTWLLRGTRQNRTATAVTLPNTTAATLSTLNSVHVYSFTLSTSTNTTIDVLCQGKASPSDMDPRLSLYNASTKSYVQTNDDISLSNVDSRLTGTLPPATYYLVIDNVSPTATNVSYELRVTTQ